MASRKEQEKESVIKLVKFTLAITCVYLAILQIAVLVNHYSIKEKTVSHEVSQEDAPIPSIVICGETHRLIKQDVLDKYGVKSLLLEQDPDKPSNAHMTQYVKSQWRRFDWSSISLKQLYNEAVIYPRELLASCTIGDNYNCTESEDIYHRWENVLKRSHTCSTLRITKKLAYEEWTFVDVQLRWPQTSVFQFQIYDAWKSFPRYINKFPYYEFSSNDYFFIAITGEVKQLRYKYSFEKFERLSEDGGQSCSKDPTTDSVKCKEDCFEAALLQDNSSCVLPWTMSDKRQCNNIDEALAMVEKEKELLNIQCDCQDHCTEFKLVHSLPLIIYKPTMGINVFLDNSHGITTLRESYMYSFIDLLSNCGGSLGIFFSVSLLWLTEEAIKALCSFERFSKLLSPRFAEPFVNYLLKASFLACLTIFLYESSHLVMKYLQSQKTLTVDRLHPMESPPPNIVICNHDIIHSSYLGKEHLESNYAMDLIASPKQHMIGCQLDNETCMVDGPSFSWDVVYGVTSVCSIFRYNNRQHSNLDIIFDDAFSLFTVHLSSSGMVVKYSLDDAIYYATFTPHSFLSMTYKLNQKYNLPPCSDNYIQCRERCWEEHFLKEDLCTPPDMPPEVKYQPCKTVDEFIALLDYFKTYTDFGNLCRCDHQCLDEMYTLEGFQNVYDSGKSKLRVSLVPFQFVRTTEVWTYPFNSLIAGVGGTLGVITGLSFLSVLLNAFSKFQALLLQDSEKRLLTNKTGRIIIYLTILGFLFQQVYTSVSHYLDGRVQLNEEIYKESLTILPTITLCYVFDIYFTISGDVIAMSPYESLQVHEDPATEINWNSSWLYIEDFLIDCTVFGFPCKEQKGEIHEWRNMKNVNTFCSRLEIKPVKLLNYKSNRLTLKMNHNLRFYLSSAEENRLFHLSAAFDNYYDIILSNKNIFFLHRSQYKLLQEKPNNCINRLGYNQRNCLDECISDHIQQTLRCRFPWMKFHPSLRICQDSSDYSYLHSINSSLLVGCQCLLPCQYTDSYLVLRGELTSHNNEALAEIIVLESNKVYKESLSYTASRCLADIGGLMSLFTGLAVYGILCSSASYCENLWKLLL